MYIRLNSPQRIDENGYSFRANSSWKLLEVIIDYVKNCSNVLSMSFVIVSSSVSPTMVSNCSAKSSVPFR
jgi:hypothetical protein